MRKRTSRITAVIGLVFALATTFTSVAWAGSSQSDQSDTGIELPDVSGARPTPLPEFSGTPVGSGEPAVAADSETYGRRYKADAASGVATGVPANRQNWHGFTKPMAAVGQLFTWHAGDQNPARCTATVVTRGLLITAGHCTFGAVRMVFVPASANASQDANWNNITAPYGVWEAQDYWVPGEYTADQRPDGTGLDWSLVQIQAASDGTQIGDVTGAWPMTTNVPFEDGTRIFSTGYPAEGFWAAAENGAGKNQYACDMSWTGGQFTPAFAGGYTIWEQCPMNQGSSGGPWFVQFSDNKWYIGGVTNWCNGANTCDPVSANLLSQMFDSRFDTFWNSVMPLVH
jgi:hypothetical protein